MHYVGCCGGNGGVDGDRNGTGNEVSVVMCVIWSRAGQSVTVAGHWVRVTVLVERIVEIV